MMLKRLKARKFCAKMNMREYAFPEKDSARRIPMNEIYTASCLEKVLLHKKGELMSKVNPQTLQKAIETMSEVNHYKEGVKVSFDFTDKKNCGVKIIDILTRRV